MRVKRETEREGGPGGSVEGNSLIALELVECGFRELTSLDEEKRQGRVKVGTLGKLFRERQAHIIVA